MAELFGNVVVLAELTLQLQTAIPNVMAIAKTIVTATVKVTAQTMMTGISIYAILIVSN